MSDEIKEILEDIKEIYYFKPILDYITNLQEENKELNRMCEIYSKSLYNADLTKAEKRIEKAKELINAWLEGLNNDDIIILLNDLLNILGGDKE